MGCGFTPSLMPDNVGCSDSRRGERCATVGGGVIRAAMGGDVWWIHRTVVFNGLVGFTCAKV